MSLFCEKLFSYRCFIINLKYNICELTNLNGPVKSVTVNSCSRIFVYVKYVSGKLYFEIKQTGNALTFFLLLKTNKI